MACLTVAVGDPSHGNQRVHAALRFSLVPLLGDNVSRFRVPFLGDGTGEGGDIWGFPK